jgi:hypothetical protein
VVTSSLALSSMMMMIRELVSSFGIYKWGRIESNQINLSRGAWLMNTSVVCVLLGIW